jgi:hypothetical protein
VSTDLETALFPPEGLERPTMAVEPRATPAASAEPPAPRERYRAVLRDALPEGLVLSPRFWAVALAGADEYAAAMVEQHARKPGKTLR